ncbi:MAG: DUF4215 domain-containing protein [Alphaproteobacteria bacterium]|nr:DUF4215 domain-containing protein [Alphaproteobacteria bacterium]
MSPWILSALLSGGLVSSARAAPTVDALHWDDDLTDAAGVFLQRTQGFAHEPGGFRATGQVGSIATDCIALRPPTGGALLGWDWLEVHAQDFDHVTRATVRVETCGQFSQSLTSADLTGCDVIDLSAVPPTVTGVRLIIDVDHDAAATTPRFLLDRLEVVGRSTSVARVTAWPVGTEARAGDPVAWYLTVTGSGALLPDATLTLDLDALNADATLVSDAHDLDLAPNDTTARPLAFLDVAPGPDGSPASTPAPGATSGAVTWALGDVPAGTTQGLTTLLTAPTGTLDGSTLAVAARLDTHRAPTCPSSQTSALTSTADSRALPITVHSATQVVFFNGPGAGERIHPGASWTDYVELQSPLAGTPDRSDLSDVDFVIDFGAGSCTPVYVGYDIAWPDTQPAAWRVVDVVSEPTPGAIATGPLHLRLPRVVQASDRPQLLVTYAGPDDGSCVDGDTLQLHVEVSADQPEVALDTTHRAQPFEEDDELCRSGFVRWPQRVMSGGEVPEDYLPFPGVNPQEAYLIGFGLNEFGARPFSVGPGDWYDMWLPWTNYGTNAPSIAVDASYVLGTIPGYATFRGIRDTSFTTPLRAFKDCAGGALDPDDAAFDHADPTQSGWSAVDATFGTPYAPFTATPADADPRAIVPGGCRVLLERSPDDPLGDDPTMIITALMRMCDAADAAAGWCTTPADGAEVLAWSGEMPPYFEMMVWHDGVTTVCDTTANVTGAYFYLEEASWPRVFVTPAGDAVPPGGTASFVLEPHNENQASRPALAVWGLSLFDARDAVDLTAVTGAAALPPGGRMPTGAALSDITFHPPDAAGCLAAVDALDPACLAWFEVADRAQPPNYWGVADPNQKGRLAAIDTWEGHVDLPLTGGQDGAIVAVAGQARAFTRTATACTTDATCGAGARCATAEGVCWTVGDLGAANASPRYTCGDACDVPAEVVVHDAPALRVAKAAPAYALAGTTVPYVLTLTNPSSTPVAGWWLVDQVPVAGIEGGDVTGDLGRAWIDLPPGDVIVETSDSPLCARPNTRTFPTGWTAVAVEATTEPGYRSRTVDPLVTTGCVRIRGARPDVAVAGGTTLAVRLDVAMPPGSTDGQRMINAAFGGATTGFGAAVPVPDAAAPLVYTKAGSTAAVELSKSGFASRTEPGLVTWTLTVHNAGALSDPLGTTVTDCLPDGVDLVAITPPAGGSCIPADCATAVITPTCPSGEITVTVPPLFPDDLQPGGPDEVSFTVTTQLTTATDALVNTATATPRSPGTSDDAVATVLVGGLTFDKAVVAVPPNGTADPVLVRNGEQVHYTLTLTNDLQVDRWFHLVDAIPDGVTYVQGSLRIDGAVGSESLVRFGRTLTMVSPAAVPPGGTLVVAFDAIGDALTTTLTTNVGVAASCPDDTADSACATAVASNAVQVLVEVCGDSQTSVSEDCDDGNTDDEDGCSSTCQDEVCGDGIVQAALGEACDDGNTANGDGCTATCVAEGCGDGVRQAGLGEQCDDGNLVDGDGCSSACLDEFCGDGVVQPGLGETCDDANSIDEDGCSSTCRIEACGDGVVQASAGETCDDGNTVDGDGCDSNCQTERCGDGIVQAGLGEACDDGNTVDEDGCSSTCQDEVCGDGIVQRGLGETCDDGNTSGGDGCSEDCQREGGLDSDTGFDTGGGGKDDGCQCSQGLSTSAGWWVLLTGLLGIRRRQR